MLLEHKVAIITGSTKGIGEAATYAFAREGAKVLVTGRECRAGSEVVDALVTSGSMMQILPLVCWINWQTTI